MHVKRRNTDMEYINFINKLPHFQNSPSHFTNSLHGIKQLLSPFSELTSSFIQQIFYSNHKVAQYVSRINNRDV